MPGKISKPAHAPRPAVGKAFKRANPPMPSRPSQPVRPFGNPALNAARNMRREAQQLAKQTVQNRPRPVVRPAAPPAKIMSKTPAAQVQPRGKILRRSPVPAPGTAPAPVAGSGRLARLGIAGAGAALGLVALNTAIAAPEISGEANSLQTSLNNLQSRSAFTEATTRINDLTTLLNRLPELLESARQKGYSYGADIDQRLYDLMAQWESLQPQLVQMVQQQSDHLQNQLNQVNNLVYQLNGRLGNANLASAPLRSTRDAVNSVLNQVSEVERSLQNSYEPVEQAAAEINSHLTTIHWALEQLAQAKFALGGEEDLVLAVAARWDKEGNEDPEGVLYLTDQRLIFERKEKVATKKILFITTASEFIQEVVVDQPLANLRSVQADNKGLFGHQDYVHVAFSEAGLGTVAYHIKGQPAKEWAALIEKARTGGLAAERTGGTGSLSVSDLVGPLTTGHLMSLQSEINDLQDDLMLQATRQELSELENDVHGLERKLAEVRQQGYGVERDLEGDLAILLAQWERVKIRSESMLDHYVRTHSEVSQTMHATLGRLMAMSGNLVEARPVYMQLKSTLASAEAQVEAAEDTVLAQYDDYADEITAFGAHLDWVKWMLDALATASFRLLATECGIAAVEAVFEHPSLGPENGILFLTDQRLLWEDRVGDYELKVNVPLAAVQDVKKEESGEAQALLFSFNAPAPLPSGRFLLAMPVAEDWLKMVGRARSGGYARDLAVSITQEELDRVRNAPQQCQKCGATFAAPILRGQMEIQCEYCGLVTRI